MTKKIGLQEARNLLREALHTQGRDFVYNPNGGLCINVPVTGENPDVPEDSPKRKTGCIAGTAMHLSGRVDNMLDFRTGTVDVFHAFLTGPAEKYLRQAQKAQDNSQTWGEAFDRAEIWAEGFMFYRQFAGELD